MATSSNAAQRTITRILERSTLEEYLERISPLPIEKVPQPAEVPEIRNWSDEACRQRQAFVEESIGTAIPHLAGREPIASWSRFKGNIESCIGMTQIPTGLIGPLRVNGSEAKGDFYVPLATTEGALVASYHRGARIASRAGGVTAVCLTEAVQRSPSFRFASFAEGGVFLMWTLQQIHRFQEIVGGVSRHARLEEVKPNVDGNQITLVFEYTTGDAAGQNMVTVCTEAICRFIVSESPVKPAFWCVEGNLSGDKKATAQSFLTVRGKKVTAEVVLRRPHVEEMLHTTPERMMEYWKMSVINGIQSGSIGVNGHFANGLAAIFLACGQDVACVSEASVGTTRMDVTDGGDLYVCATLPNMIVGSVGGGTSLPTQAECLRILDCLGAERARKLAEICAATVLCGEVSIVGAIAAGDFAKAHALFGRGRNEKLKM